MKDYLNTIHAEHTKQINAITGTFSTAMEDMGSKFVTTITKNHEDNLRLHEASNKKLDAVMTKMDEIVTKRKRNA